MTAVLLFAVGCALLTLVAHASYGYGDFGYFHQDATAWWRTGTVYAPPSSGRVNLNLPHVALLMGPLGAIPLHMAWTLWTALQIGLGCDVLRRVLRSIDLSDPILLSVLLLVAPATVAQLALAQIAWLLAWLVTLAWESRKPVAAGVFIGLAAAMKPFLLLVIAWWVLRRNWSAVFTAVGVCLAVVLATNLAVGPEPYLAWLVRVSEVSWENLALNWSLLGVWRRVMPPDVSIGWLWGIELGVLLLVLLNLRGHAVSRDGGWLLSLGAGLALSPLGWGYYAWILLGPAARFVKTNWRGHTDLLPALLLWVPPGLLPVVPLNTIGILALGSRVMHSKHQRGSAGT